MVINYEEQKKAIEHEFTEFFKHQVLDSFHGQFAAEGWEFKGEILLFSHNFQITARRSANTFTAEFAEISTDVIYIGANISHSTGIIEEEDVKVIKQTLDIQHRFFDVAFWPGTKEELAKLQRQWLILKNAVNASE
jgi:hypothetical protein